MFEGLVADHINGMRSDNRLDNLRIVTQQENMRNKKIQQRNSLGKQGVYLWTNKSGRRYWKCQINDVDKKFIQKLFSVDRHGEEPAKNMAIAERLRLEQLYGYIGE